MDWLKRGFGKRECRIILHYVDFRWEHRQLTKAPVNWSSPKLYRSKSINTIASVLPRLSVDSVPGEECQQDGVGLTAKRSPAAPPQKGYGESPKSDSISRARELRCAGVPAASVAVHTGFYDQLHQSFKSHFGLTHGKIGVVLSIDRRNAIRF